MAYMSKTKRRRVRRQQLIRGLIAIAVIAAVLVVIWQVSLGARVVKVNDVTIRSSMIEGVEAFVTYYQTGQFPNDSLRGLTGEERDTAVDMALVARNSLVQSIFINNELVTQHFKAEGKVFPSAEQTAEIKETIDIMFSNIELARSFRSNGINKSHVEFYYTYQAAISDFMEEVLAKNPVTDEEIGQYYELYKFYFSTPVTLTASHILIMDPDHTAAKRAEIEAILEKLNEGEDFAALAMEYSEDGSAANGGDLGEFGLGQMVAPFEEAALELEPGEISGIVETEFGFHIIKLTDKTEAGYQTVDEVRDQLEELIASDRTSEALAELRTEAVIVYFVLVNPTTGKPPISLSELDEARGIVAEEEDVYEEGDGYEDDDHDHDHDHEGHDHD